MEQIKKDKNINIPNLLTILRIALIPVVVWRYLVGDKTGALVVYIIAMLTDVVDGYLARRFHQVTALGKLLDPIADKLSLLALLGLFVADGSIPLWVLFIELLREVTFMVGGALALRKGIVVSALPIGKITTVCFVLSIVTRFIQLTQVADILLYVSLVLSIIALIWYGVVLFRQLGWLHLPKSKDKKDSTK